MADLGQGVTHTLAQFIDQQPRVETPQERFAARYITAGEIMARIDVTRPTVIHRMNTRFPAIKIGNTYVWERSTETGAFIDAWEVMRELGE